MKYADVLGYKITRLLTIIIISKTFTMLDKQTSKEGMPDNLHKVVYSVSDTIIISRVSTTVYLAFLLFVCSQ